MVSLKFCSNFHLKKRDKNQDNFIIPYMLFEFHVGGIGILAYMCLKLKIWLKQSQNEQAQFNVRNIHVPQQHLYVHVFY